MNGSHLSVVFFQPKDTTKKIIIFLLKFSAESITIPTCILIESVKKNSHIFAQEN